MRELTVILDAAGKITAAQVRGADGVARGLALGDLPASLKSVNEAALLSLAELVTVRAELEATKEQGRQAAQGVLDAPDRQACNAIARGILQNKRQRDRAAALVKLAEAQKEVDKYEI